MYSSTLGIVGLAGRLPLVIDEGDHTADRRLAALELPGEHADQAALVQDLFHVAAIKVNVADAIEECGTLLELQGENPFRCNAYHNGARALRSLSDDLATLVEEKRLAEVRGIGSTLQEKIGLLVTTGKLPFLDELRKKVPAGLVEMLRLPGMGAKKVKALHDSLGVDTIEKLKAACDSGEVARLKGAPQG